MRTPLRKLPGAGTAVVFTGLLLSAAVFFTAAKDPVPLTALDSAGSIFVQRKGQGEFLPLSAGGVIRSGDVVRTSPHAFLELGLSGNWNLRLEEESEAIVYPPRLYQREKTYKIRMNEGNLFAASSVLPPRDSLIIEAEGTELRPAEGAFVGQASGSRLIKATVLKGALQVVSRGVEPVTVRNLETIHLNGADITTTPVNFQTWRKAFPAYLMKPRSENFRRTNLGYAGRAGSFFRCAYYIGEFYTNQQGYLDSYFEEKDGEDPHMRIFYDLQAMDTFAGVYVQMKDLYLDEYQRFTFEARRAAELAPPSAFQIEFKNQHKIVKSIKVREVPENWTPFSLDLNLSSSTPVTEAVVIVYQRDVKPGSQGGLELRRMELHAGPSAEVRP